MTSSEKLEKSLRDLDFVIKGAGIGTWEWNVRTNETLFNDLWASMLGYTIEELTPYDYTTWERLVHPEDLDQAVRALDDCVRGRVSDYRCEFRMRHKDGHWVWILDQGRVMTRDEEGNPLEMFGTHTDISWIKRTEKELQENEARFRAIVEDQTDAIVRFSRDGTISWLNEHGAALTGQSPRDLIGRNFFNFLSPEEQKNVEESLGKISMVNQVEESIQQLTLPGGETRWLQWRNRGVFNQTGDIIEYQGVGRDITERKLAEEATVKAERRFRGLIENASDGVIITSSEGLTIYASPNGLRNFGYSEKDLESNKIGPECIHPDDLPAVVEIFNQIRENPEIQPTRQYRFKKKNGEYRWIETTFTNLLDDPAVGGFVLNYRDVTERREQDRAKSELNQRYQTVIKNFPKGAVFLLDRDMRYIHVDGKAIKEVGLDPEKMIGRTVKEVFPPEVSEVAEINQRLLFEGKPCYYEVEFAGNFYANWGEPVRDEKDSIQEGVIFAVDISDLKAAQAQLQISLDRFSSLVWNLQSGVFYINTKGEILEVNPAMLAMLGSPSQEKTKEINIFDFKPLRDIGYTAKLKECIKTKRMVKGEAVYTSLWGKTTTVEYYFVPLLMDGEVMGVLSSNDDVTDQREKEQALNILNERYRKAQELGVVGNWELDLGTGEFWGSEQAKRIFGLNPEINAFSREEVFECIPEKGRLIQAYDDLIERDGSLNLEHSIITRDDKREKVLSSRAELERDRNGRPVRIVGVIHDITKRIEYERELLLAKERAEENEDFLNRTGEMARVGGWFINEDLSKVYWTQTTSRIHEMPDGYVPNIEEAIDFYYPDDQPLVKKSLDDAISRGEPFNFKARLMTAKGKTLWVQALGSPEMRGGKCIRVSGTFQDISERKKAEEQLATERERLTVTLESIGDGVIATDKNGRIVLLNKAAQEMTGWSSSEAKGRSLSEVFPIINENSREKCENPVARVLKSNRIVELANHTALLTKDNREIIISNSAAPMRTADGKTIGVVLVFRDMTEKKRLENAIEVSSRLESLGVLAGGIAHDFNNLLGGIYGYIDLAMDSENKETTNSYLAETAHTIERARGLTQQLLTFASGGAPIQRITSLMPFLQETVQFALSGSNVSSHIDIPRDLWNSNYDRNQIGQVIDNLIINAQQAMPVGGAIDVSARNINFSEGEHPLLGQGEYVKISIRDRGIGIPKELLDKIFDPFFTTKSKGHGLGLATCYSIVNRHGGYIDVESEPGKGSEFIVYLPAENSTEDTDVEQKEKEHRGSGTFLVMDDEETIRDILKLMLESFGYRVVCKEDGKGALEFLASESEAGRSPGAAIFDLTVPGGMGGMEAIAELRQTDGVTPVFVASGYADGPVMKNPEKYGFTASIGKPFRRVDLMEILNEYLGEKMS